MSLLSFAFSKPILLIRLSLSIFKKILLISSICSFIFCFESCISLLLNNSFFISLVSNLISLPIPFLGKELYIIFLGLFFLN